MARPSKKRRKRPPASAPSTREERTPRRFDPTLWGLWLLILVPPFIVGPGTDSFRLPKLAASELLALVSMALLAWRLWRPGSVDLGRLGRSPALWAVLPLVMVASVGAFVGEHQALTASRLPSLWIGAAALVVWSLALEPAERRRLLAGLCIPATVLGFIGIAQFHGFQLFAFTERLTERLTVTSLAGGAFDLAAYMTLPILLAQHHLASSSGWRRGLWIACLTICSYAVLATQTLSALAAVVLGTLILWLPRLGRRLGRRRAMLWGGGVLAFTAVVVLAVAPLRTRVVEKTRNVYYGDWDRLLSGRLDGWRAAGWMLAEHPLTGVGHGAYRAEFGEARLALSAEGVQFFVGQSNPFFANAHNEWAEAGAELGMPGLVAVGFAMWQIGMALRRRRRLDAVGEVGEPGGAPWSDLERAAWAAIAFHAFFDFPFHLALLAYPWLLLASDTLRPVEPLETVTVRASDDDAARGPASGPIDGAVRA